MKIVNLEEYRKNKKLVAAMATHEVKVDEDQVLHFVTQQSEIIEALLHDIALLTGQHLDLQNQFKIVAAQAFLALEVLQEKEIVMEEELQAKFEALMTKLQKKEEPDEKKEMAEVKEMSPEKPPVPSNIPGAYEPTEEDLGRILAGEDPAKVFFGKF